MTKKANNKLFPNISNLVENYYQMDKLQASHPKLQSFTSIPKVLSKIPQ